jgi:hypothetical protein
MHHGCNLLENYTELTPKYQDTNFIPKQREGRGIVLPADCPARSDGGQVSELASAKPGLSDWRTKYAADIALGQYELAIRTKQLQQLQPPARLPDPIIVQPPISFQPIHTEEENKGRLPNDIRIFPGMAVAAFSGSGAGRAWRCWTLARDIDKPGAGLVMRSELLARFEQLGVSSRQVNRFISDAKRTGLISKVIHRGSSEGYLLAGAVQAARLLHCRHVGSRPVKVSIRGLFAPGWHNLAWCAFLSIFDGPISREKLRELTGIPERTQYKLERENGLVDYRKNYAVSKLPADHTQGIRKIHRGAFAYKGRVAWRLPDKRTVSMLVAVPGSRGRVRKINRELNTSQANLCILAQVPSDEVIRLFHTDHRAIKQTIRRTAKIDGWAGIREVYEKIPDHPRRRPSLWMPEVVCERP